MAIAVSRRVGLIAVDLLGSRKTFSVIPQRIDATGVTLSTDAMQPADLDPIVGQIANIFPHEAARRSGWQDRNLHSTLAAAGKSFTRRPGPLRPPRQRRPTGAGDECYAADGWPVHGNRGPAQPGGGRLSGRYRQLRCCAVWAALGGPLRPLPGDRLARQKSGVDVQDEGQLMRYVERIP